VIKIAWWIWVLIVFGVIIVWVIIVDSLTSGNSEGGVGTKLVNSFHYLCCGGRK